MEYRKFGDTYIVRMDPETEGFIGCGVITFELLHHQVSPALCVLPICAKGERHNS